MPIVLLHGLNESLESFRPHLEPLSKVARVYAVDLRGHGETDWAENRYSIADYAADVIAFLSANLDEPPVLVGHSLGALVAAYIASNSDIALLGLILAEPPMFSAQMPALQDTQFYGIFAQARSMLRTHQATDGTVEEMVEIVSNFRAGPGVTMLEAIGEEGVRVFATQLHHTDPDTLNAPLEGTFFDGFDPAGDLANIGVPTHVMAGNVERGGALPLEDVMMICEAIPNCTYVVRSDVGHEIHAMLPRHFVLEIETFVRTMDRIHGWQE